MDYSKYENPIRWSLDDPDRREKAKAYHDEQERLRQLFQQDLAAEHGFQYTHPAVAKALSFAWQEGHASGYPEVAYYFGELAEILRLAWVGR